MLTSNPLPQLKIVQSPLSTVSLQNPQSSPFTIEALRHFAGCEHYTDEQAADVIVTLDALARIFLQAAIQHGTRYDNQEQSLITISSQGKTVHKRAA